MLPRMIVTAIFFVCLNFYASENLLPNGNFDAGNAGAEHWEPVDNLTSFWVNEKGRGRILKLDSRIERKQALAWQKEFKTGKNKKPAAAIIPKNQLASIGAYEGAVLDSGLIDVIPGQTYTLSVDVKGKCGIIVWIKGFMLHPRRKQLTDSYQTRLCPEGINAEKWTTCSISFSPTKRMPRTSKMKVRIFVYWPTGVAYFDNVRITKNK